MWIVEFLGSKGWEISLEAGTRLEAFDYFDELMADVKTGEIQGARITFESR